MHLGKRREKREKSRERSSDFMFNRCGHCKKIEKDYAQAAFRLAEQNMEVF